jgi:hypothetical protein
MPHMRAEKYPKTSINGQIEVALDGWRNMPIMTTTPYPGHFYSKEKTLGNEGPSLKTEKLIFMHQAWRISSIISFFLFCLSF